VWANNETVAAGHSIDPARWREAFEGLMERLAGRFTRVEPRRRAGRLVLGLLADLPRKNCWTIAEWAGEATPYGMQHLLAGPHGTPMPSVTISSPSSAPANTPATPPPTT
jgi:hypothetical protein